MNVLLSSVCVLGASILLAHAEVEVDDIADLTWDQWKVTYGRQYDTPSDEELHAAIWTENLRYVTEHNGNPDASFRLGMNQFADNLPTVRSVLYTAEPNVVNNYHGPVVSLRFAPSSWDWRKQGAVTPVRNQGASGDVFSIVVTEEIESYNFIHTKKLIELSINETKECCVPMHMPFISLQTMFTCIADIGGLCAAADYHNMGTCNNATCTGYGKIHGTKQVPSRNEDDLKMAVLQVPVIAAIDASSVSFQLYKSGIYSNLACSRTRLDHVLQVVGYGSQGRHDFWIGRNSWGRDWGMQGYVLMARNKGNMCGIATAALYPV